MTPPVLVVTRDGERGTLHRDETAPQGRTIVRLQGKRFAVPTVRLERRADGTYRLPWDGADLVDFALPAADAAPPEADGRATIPVAEERVDATVRASAARVRVRTIVNEREETVEVPLEATEVEVRRVPVGRPVERAPDVRTEGDTTIIPVVRERVVIRRQLMLDAEIHVTRKRVAELHRETLTLREEDVEIDRTDEE